MKSDKNEEIMSSKKSSRAIDYQIKPMSVKLTPKVDEMLTYISDTTQMSRSNIVRYSITELYRKLKAQNPGDLIE